MLLVLTIFTALSSASAKIFENEITFKVLSHLGIGRCILLTNFRDDDIIGRMKYLTSRNILTVAMDIPDLLNYFYYSKTTPPHREAVVGGLHIIAQSNILSQVYRPPHVERIFWLVFPSGHLNALGTLRVPYNCQFVICYKEHTEDETYGLYEFYYLRGENVFKTFGVWNEADGLIVSPLPFYPRRYDLNGTELVMLRSQESGYESDTECANVKLWLAMGEMMNFKTRFVTPSILMREPHVIPDVLSRSLAFHAASFEIDSFGLQTIAPIWRIRMFMYVRHEIDESSRWAAYIRPLSRAVWFSLTSTLLLASVCLIIIGHYVSRKLHAHPCVELGFTPLDSICNQGGTVIGHKSSKRIAVASTRLIALTISHAYSGVIISTLTLQYPIFPFVDLAGFAQSGQYRMGAVNATFGVGYFRHSDNPTVKMIANGLFESTSQLPVDSWQGLKKCCEGKYAFIADEDVLLTVDRNKLPCRILRIPSPAFVTYAGMRLDDFTEYRRVFFFNLLYFYSSGILKKLGAKPQLPELKQEEYEEVTLSQVYSLLTLLAVGCVIGFIIMFLEVWFSRKEKTIEKKGKQLFLYDGLWRIRVK